MTEPTFNKRTGYKMADREVGYRGVKYSEKCFQRELRDKKLHPNEVMDTLDDMRNAVVKEIPFKVAQEFILDYEWLGTMGTTKFSFGVYTNDRLTAVYCFGLTAGTSALSEVFGEANKHKGIVLVRGACAPWAYKHMSTFGLGRVLPLVNDRGYEFVIAYSDPESGEIGTVYQADNWNLYGVTNRINYLVRPDGKRVDPKLIHKYAKKHGITSAEQKQMFINEGYTFERGGHKLKYFKCIGNKRTKKMLMKDRKVNILSYPKRREDMSSVCEDVKREIKELKCQD